MGVQSAALAAAPADEHARTMVFAEAALNQLQALRLAATPRNYEIWYAYATGHYPSLNLIVNDMLARRIALAGDTLDQVGARFLSPSGIKERIDSVGSRVAQEIQQVVASIDSTMGTAGACSEDLEQVDGTLAALRNRDAVRAVVERMVLVASKIEEDKRRLEAQLNASRLEFGQLREELKIIHNASLTDPLTGLANRKSFEHSLQKAMAEAVGNGEPLSLVMADIDYFKAFNDSWGHLTGDQVLRLVAAAIKHSVKGQDVVARYGGEEFAVVLSDASLDAAHNVADQIRRSIMSRDVLSRSTGQNLGRVTISFGVAGAHAHDSMASLIARADACLYCAKCNGRNRVICENDPEFTGAAVRSDVA
jgi:diguanylate cyclase